MRGDSHNHLTACSPLGKPRGSSSTSVTFVSAPTLAEPEANQRSNLTDEDSRLMRKNERAEFE